MATRIAIPRFATELEEADWWSEKREAHDEVMAKALEDRSATNLVKLLTEQEQNLPRVSVRFDYGDIARAGKQAAARGLELESYVRELLHEALLKNGAA